MRSRSCDSGPHPPRRGPRRAAARSAPGACPGADRRARTPVVGLAVALVLALVLGLFLGPIGLVASARAQAPGPGDSATPGARLLDIVFVLDNSGSMRAHDPGFLTREAVIDFAAALASDPEVDARVGLVLFDGEARLVHALSSKTSSETSSDPSSTASPGASVEAPVEAVRVDEEGSRSSLSETLLALDFSGQRTNSPAGIERALYELERNARPDARRAIVLLSDGKIDTGDAAGDLEASRWLREELTSESVSRNVQIFGIAFSEAADYQLMQALALETRARYYRALAVDELEGVIADVLEHLRESPAEIALAAGPDADGETVLPDVATAAPAGGAGQGLGLLGWLPFAVLLLAGAVVWSRRHRNATGSAVGPDREPALVAPAAQILDPGGHIAEPGAAFPLRSGLTRIGRDPHNDLVIDDDTISSEHAVIEVRQGRYWLEDRRSTNGTHLGPERLTPGTPVELKGGDSIRLAEIGVLFVLSGYVPGGATVYLSSTTRPSVAWEAEPEPPALQHGPERVDGDLESMDGGPDSLAGGDRQAERAGEIESAGDAPRPETDARSSKSIEVAEEEVRIAALESAPSEAPVEPDPAPESEVEIENTSALAATDPAESGPYESAPSERAERPITSLPDPEVRSHRECLDLHLARVQEISPAFAAFVERIFDEEIRDALSVAARDLLGEARERDTLTRKEYTNDGVRFLVCAVPGEIETARERYGALFGGFTRLLSEALQSESFQRDRCEVLAVLTVGLGRTPWVSLSIVPEEGQDPGIDLLSYELLSPEERREIEPAVDGELSQSGLA